MPSEELAAADVKPVHQVVTSETASDSEQANQEELKTHDDDEQSSPPNPGNHESRPLLGNRPRSEAGLRLDPPERIVVSSDTRYRVRWLGISWSGRIEEPLCARANFQPHPRRGLYTDLHKWTRGQGQGSSAQEEGNDQQDGLNLKWLLSSERKMDCYMETQRRYAHNHIVIGIMDKWTGVPRERLIEGIAHQHLFQAIRLASRQLRPWWKRVLSLKSIQGFAVYQCHPVHAYHEAVDLDRQTELLLTELFHDYTRRNTLSELRWLPWIQQRFNHGDREPGKPCYALQLILRWSIAKIAVYGVTPIILSLAVGFWFQYAQEGDRIAIVQTAWTISSFIIGGASVLIAVIAAITQLGGI